MGAKEGMSCSGTREFSVCPLHMDCSCGCFEGTVPRGWHVVCSLWQWRDTTGFRL